MNRARLVRAVDEQHAALEHRVVGDHADHLTVQAGEPDHQFLRPQRVDLEERTLVHQPAHEPAHVEGLPLVGRHQRAQVDGLGLFGGGGGRRPVPVRGQVAQVPPDDLERLRLGLGQEVPAPAHRAVHPGTAHLLQGGLLLDDHLDHARRPEVHRGVALDHDHDVTERRDVGPTRGRGTEQRAHLGHRTAGPDLTVEYPAGPPPSREQVDLVGDAGAGGVHEVDHRDLGPEGRLDDPDDLLDGSRAPGTRFDRRVVGHEAHGAPVHRRRAGDDAVGGQVAGDDVGEQAVLDERPLVDEQPHPLAREELAPRGVRLVVFSRTALLDGRAHLGDGRMVRHGVVCTGLHASSLPDKRPAGGAGADDPRAAGAGSARPDRHRRSGHARSPRRVSRRRGRPAGSAGSAARPAGPGWATCVPRAAPPRPPHRSLLRGRPPCRYPCPRPCGRGLRCRRCP